MPEPGFVVWGPELSPFLLKLEAMLAFRGIPWRRLPRDGSRLENLRYSIAVHRAVRRRTALRPPANDPVDEYPLVPFLVLPDGEVLYDTSALAAWLDERSGPGQPLVPEDPAVRFVARFVDEAFDEFGLYLVHHNRWKLAAMDNEDPGMRLAREYVRLLPPGASRAFARWFARRQVRRLPYLFSVAPSAYEVPGLPPALTPPSRPGFPPTHELLEQAWIRYLEATERVLAAQPFLLGAAFTVADASAYGQLSMNLTDGLAARRLRDVAPRTYAWLGMIRDRRHVGSSGAPLLSPSIEPLIDVVLETFVPLMRANSAACRAAIAAGRRVFNERAFDAGENLYDGKLAGHAFRHVAKSFQARSWRDLCADWSALDAASKSRVAALARRDSLDAELVSSL